MARGGSKEQEDEAHATTGGIRRHTTYHQQPSCSGRRPVAWQLQLARSSRLFFSVNELSSYPHQPAASASSCSAENAHDGDTTPFGHNKKKKDEFPTVRLWGLALYAATFVFFTVSMFLMFFSKFLPDEGNPILLAIKRDWHYSLLLPCLIPTTIVFIYCKWVSMKFFRHA